MKGSDIAPVVLALLWACGDGNIGEDSCTGEHTRCRETDIVRLPMGLPQEMSFEEVDSSALPELAPTWQHALTFLPEQTRDLDAGDGTTFFAAGSAFGNGQAGLWYVRGFTSPDGLQVFKLDPEGAPIDSVMIAPPSGIVTPKGRGKPMLGGYVNTVDDQGPAPILTATWGAAGDGCDDASSCPSVIETIALDRDLDGEPLRVIQSGDAARDVARSDDGGLWGFSSYGVRKYDARGRVEIQQSLLQRASPFPTIRGGYGRGYHSEAQLALTSSGALWIHAFAAVGLPELWQLDEHGNVQRHYSLGDTRYNGVPFSATGAAIVATDRNDLPVVFGESELGDLLVYRLDAERDQAFRRHVLRNDFTSLEPRSVSEDSAGNLYVISLSGQRDAPVPVLCKLPLDGELACYTLPKVTVRTLVFDDIRLIGGAEDVVYLYHIAELDESTHELLTRLDLPH